MRKTLIAAALGALALVPAAAPAAAAPGEFQSWLSREIDRNMVYPAALRRSRASGIATVRFTVGDGRRPSAVALARSSGHGGLDAAALRLVASLDLPDSAPAGTHVAVLQYGESAGMADDMRQTVQLREAEQRARLELRGGAEQQLAEGRGASPFAG